MASMLVLRWPLCWMANVEDTIGPLLIGLLSSELLEIGPGRDGVGLGPPLDLRALAGSALKGKSAKILEIARQIPSLVRLRRVQNRVSPILLRPTLHLAETVSDSSLPRLNQISLCREQVGILHSRATPDVVYQPWCIQYAQLEPAQTYELKFDLIHLSPKFHGLAREDPHKHLKEFHVAFPFFLDGVAMDWLYLHLILFNTWEDMKRMFLEKFFPEFRIATIRKEICGIRQHYRETLHEYWERFNKLCATCPHHQINE
ncbi:hypothetical protein CR513_22072, partial [Mucuna pruriens]